MATCALSYMFGMFGDLPNIPSTSLRPPASPPRRLVTLVANAWRPFGLRADPYFQEALTPEADADHPTTLFVGREQELRLVGSQMLGALSSRAPAVGGWPTRSASRLTARAAPCAGG